jgi:prepilin-type N-terminal cleavage/methylation domain-containing protein
MIKDWFGYGMKGHKTKHIRAGRGFTLLEATFAMVILAVAASGIFLSFATAATLQAEAQHRVLASRLAVDMVETISAEAYVQIQTDYPAGYSQTASEMGNTGDVYANYRCTVIANTSVEVDDGGQTVNLIEVTVAAYYRDMEMTRVTTLIGNQNRQ